MLMMRRFTDDQRKSLRHWGMEFLVVVASVLLALWLQGWWERRQASSDLRAAEDAIRDEIGAALREVMWRKAISQCHIDRQELLKSMLLKTEGSWPGLQENALAVRSRVPPSIIPSIYTRPGDAYATDAWRSALATGALAPMRRERFRDLVGLYNQIEALKRARDEESDAVAKMASLAFPLSLTPEMKAQMLESVYRVDRARFMFAITSPTDLANAMRKLGWDEAERMDRWIREDAAETESDGFVFRPCVAAVENPFRQRAKPTN
jgi:hypothetical protein